MAKFRSLTRVLLKNTMGVMSDGKSKKGYFLYLFIFVSFIPLIALFYFMLDTTMQALVPLHQEGTALALGFHLSSMITFVFSIFLIPSVFYFSKDSDTLLALPLKPQTILSSKFVVCLIYEYAFTFLVLMPLFIAYVTNANPSFLFYVFAIIIFITLPIYPLVLSSVISMLVMRFVPFFKNRDRFNMIGGLVTVVLAFGFSYFFNSSTMIENPHYLIDLLTSGNNSLISLFSNFFPSVPFATNAMIDGDFLQIIIYLAIVATSIVVFLFIGKWFYFKGAIGFNETGSARKVLSAEALNKANRKKNATITYMFKELKLIVRTPVYFLNCIAMCFLVPAIVFLMYFTNGGTITSQIPAEVTALLNDYLGYAVLVGFAIGFFLSNINLISSTAISREGTNISFMKYIPMSLAQQIHAKVYGGILVSTITLLLTLISIYVVAPFLPLAYFALALVSAFVTIVVGNYLGIIIDMLHPKLVWEQEAAAVKQNITGMIAMISSWAVAALMGYLVYLIIDAEISVNIAIIVLFIIFIALAIILYMSINKIAQQCFRKI